MFKHLTMRIARPYRTSVALEEEKAWIGFYRRVANPAIASEVIEHLDADAELKRNHPALYLCCKESLRKKKARQARETRIRRFMRRLLGRLLGNPESRKRLQTPHRARVVVESPPEAMREPAPDTDKGRPQAAELAAAQLNASRSCVPRLDASAAAPRSAKAA